MPALNFQKEFVTLIESGKKRQTIRPHRTNPIKPGDKIFLFTGLRTKSCKRIVIPSIMEMPDIYNPEADQRPFIECLNVEPIRIDWFGISLNNKVLEPAEAYRLCIDDGFQNDEEFINFFKTKYGLPFEGVVIKW